MLCGLLQPLPDLLPAQQRGAPGGNGHLGRPVGDGDVFDVLGFPDTVGTNRSAAEGGVLFVVEPRVGSDA